MLGDNDKVREKCAVFGIFGKGLAASRLTYFGLYALQHRGQESSGITASNGKRLLTHKGSGLVAQVYTEDNLENLKGNAAIGHNRYSTSGGASSDHNQPVAGRNDIVALVHNGNLPITTRLKQFLRNNGIDSTRANDSEMMQMAIKYFLVKGNTLEQAIKKTYPLLTGAFCLLVITKDKIAAVRDRFGIRPLSLGRVGGGYAIASETCAFSTIDATYIRDVEPGEMVVFSEKGMQSHTLAGADQKLDIFEFIYFSRPDSILLGKSVYAARRNMGIALAKENPVDADVVIPVPDSAIPAAIGFAAESRVPFEYGLVKNRYIGRTFILPDQHLRDRSVQMKLHPLPEVLKGRRVIVIDDSIVRGTTAKKLVTLIRDAGAKSVHLMVSSPPLRFPDYYGIDTPNQKNLIASSMTVVEIEKFIGADSLHYLSFGGLIKATGLPENVFCTSCFTGDYPISIGKQKAKISYKIQQNNHFPAFTHETARHSYFK